MDIRSILALSSGTVASLTNTREYAKIDQIVDEWVQFELASPTDTPCKWQLSWDRFTLSPSYASLKG